MFEFAVGGSHCVCVSVLPGDRIPGTDGHSGLPQPGFCSSTGGTGKQSGDFVPKHPARVGDLSLWTEQKAVTESECAELRNCCTCLLPSHTQLSKGLTVIPVI